MIIFHNSCPIFLVVKISLVNDFFVKFTEKKTNIFSIVFLYVKCSKTFHNTQHNITVFEHIPCFLSFKNFFFACITYFLSGSFPLVLMRNVSKKQITYHCLRDVTFSKVIFKKNSKQIHYYTVTLKDSVNEITDSVYFFLLTIQCQELLLW